MAVDLSDSVQDFSWYYNVILCVHRGRVFATGAIDGRFNDEQVIFPAGTIPEEMRPVADVHIALLPYYTRGTPLVSADSLYVPYLSTVGADGSWVLDAPLASGDSGAYTMGSSTLRAEITVALDVSWPLEQPYADAISGTGVYPGLPLAPYATGSDGWADDGMRLLNHNQLAHIHGKLIVGDGYPWVYANVDAQFATGPPGDVWPAVRMANEFGSGVLYINTDSDGEPWFGVDFTLGPPRSYQRFIYPPTRVAGNTLPVTTQVAMPTQTLAFHNTSSISCVYSFGGSPYTSPYVAGPVAEPPDPAPVDLAAAIAAMDFHPDWVTISWSLGANVAYEGHSSCPANDPYSDIAHDDTSGYGHEYGFRPAVGGASNRKFDSGGVRWDAAGPQSTTPFDSENVFGVPYLGSIGGSVYLAPATPSYAPRGLIEDAGLEHAQLLWRPADVGAGTTELFGDGRKLSGTITWTIMPFYEDSNHYLLPGDEVTVASAYALRGEGVAAPPDPSTVSAILTTDAAVPHE